MIAPSEEIFAVLRQYNPWWLGNRSMDLPAWHRAAFRELKLWIEDPPAGRALLLSGARQVGKTTLFLQAINKVLDDGTPPANVLYATFDHPLLKLIGLDKLVKLWREFIQPAEGPEFLFLDEIQATKDWQTWLKHQVDFNKRRRIAVTGSATPLTREGQESGVGRWQTVRIATLSFFEYLQIRRTPIPAIPEVSSFLRLFEWSAPEFADASARAEPLVGMFNEYLLRGGFPQCAQIESLAMAQRMLREDIVDKVLKRDMTALYGVRRVLELEQVFLYLCLHDGGMLDIAELCRSLKLNRNSVGSFIDLLEAAHLIYRLMPFGYGKEVLRGRPKLYLADPAIGPSVLLKGPALLEDATALGRSVETAFFKHVFTRYYRQSIGFTYWRGKQDREVDIISDVGGELVPFEVKYSQQHTGLRNLAGLVEFCTRRDVNRGYVITKDLGDFGIIRLSDTPEIQLAKIPAPLACYWLGQAEMQP